MGNNFIVSESNLVDSVIEFFDKPEFWKSTVGNAPKYFVHLQNGKRHLFGLSKFCAFTDISVEDYITTYRYRTDGGKTQKLIARITKKNWIPRAEVETEIQHAFDNWIEGFHPNYNVYNAHFITISVEKEIDTRKKIVTPESLEQQLILQKQIGEIGEQIAFEYELKRIRLSCKISAKNYVEHVSTINSAAGFDISSVHEGDERFIEVKSSLNRKSEFFITENEFQTLEKLGDNAFIYLVRITDLTAKEGEVYKIIQNPMKELKKGGNLKPVVYKAII